MKIRSLFIIFAIIFTAILLGRNIVYAPYFNSVFLVLGVVIAGATFINPNIGLFIIIFSMLLSPELKVGAIPGRDIVFRTEDFLLLIVTFTWLVKVAVRKELQLFRKTPLNKPIAIYIFVCIVFTLRGMLLGDVVPLKGLFYVFKYIEYFILYFMVINQIRTKSQIKIFVTALILTCLLVSIYATLRIGTGRISAPFETEGEPNTLGGYLIFLFAICFSLFLNSSSNRWRIFTGIVGLVVILPFLHTLSRGSYIAFFPMYLMLIILTRRNRAFLIVLLLLGVLSMPNILPGQVIERIKSTFIPGKLYAVPFGPEITLDESASQRIETWKVVFEKWGKRPIFGYGVSGIGFIDSQFPRVLGELGLLGLFVFIWLLLRILKNSLNILQTIDDDWAKALVIGFLAGFFGLVAHSFSASTFIIVRIMEPFWFVAAIVMVLPEITSEQEELHSKDS